MNYVIVTGHGGYASGMKSCIEAIAGEQKQFFYVDYDTCIASELLKSQYKKIMQVDPDGHYLVACDIAGASPYQMAAFLAIEDAHIQVVGGVNLSALLEIVFHLDSPMETLAETMIQTTKQTAIWFKRKGAVTHKKTPQK